MTWRGRIDPPLFCLTRPVRPLYYRLRGNADDSPPPPALNLDYARKRMLVLGGPSKANAQTIGALRDQCDVIEVDTIDQAIEALRHDHFDAVFSDSADFLPLERAL